MLSLGGRMKAYENSWRFQLPPRMPIICRIDGKAFHTWTKSLTKPYDITVRLAFDYVVDKLFKEVQGLRLAYYQSDELSLFINPYVKFDTQPYYGGNINKLNSVIASLVTGYFNEFIKVYTHSEGCIDGEPYTSNYLRLLKLPTAFFDCRSFVLPKEEVANYFLWRWQDCNRNAILGFAQSRYSHKELQGVSCAELLEKFEADLNTKELWSQVPDWYKNGVFQFIGCHSVYPVTALIKTIEAEAFYQEEE